MPIFPLYEDVVQLFAQSGITYTPTLSCRTAGRGPRTTATRRERARRRQAAPLHAARGARRQDAPPRRSGHAVAATRRLVPRRRSTRSRSTRRSRTTIVKAGGRVGVGSHGQLQGLGYHWELWMRRERRHDEPRRAALPRRSSAPKRSAWRRTWARSRPGKLADLVVLDRESAREHPQHEHDPLRDEERPALRRQHARRDLAAAEEGGGGPGDSGQPAGTGGDSVIGGRK